VLHSHPTAGRFFAHIALVHVFAPNQILQQQPLIEQTDFDEMKLMLKKMGQTKESGYSLMSTRDRPCW
jgi:hypothetical protein